MYNPQLATLIQVVECGSFAKAAEKLFISDVSVGKQMRSLENHFGFSLFERTNHGVILTPAGQIIYEDAKKAIHQSARTIEKARKAMGLESHTIRIGTSLLRPCQAFMNIWSEIDDESMPIQIEIVPFEDDPASLKTVFDSLGTNIDCIISPYSEQLKKQFQVHPLGSYKCCVALSRKHRLAKEKSLSLNDLHGESFILVKRGNSIILDEIRDEIEKKHPQIYLIDTPNMYDTSIFNDCEKNNYVMETLESWSQVHPSLSTIPMTWKYKVPYGIIYSKQPSNGMEHLIQILKSFEPLMN